MKQAQALPAKGFTIVEVLVVIVVIAVLAALSYVGYASISQRARESSVAVQLSDARKAMEVHRIQYDEWPFQEEMEETSFLPAWCHAAYKWFQETYATRVIGAAYNYGCFSGGNAPADIECMYVLVEDDDRVVIISRESSHVSPVTDVSHVSSWCQGQR